MMIAHQAPRARSMYRHRLAVRLDDIVTTRLAVVVAPAGAGKTTALADWAEASSFPVGWCNADAGDVSATALLGHLSACLADVIGTEAPWRDVDHARDSLGAWSGQLAVLIVDDVHNLAGTEAEGVLCRLAEVLPPNIRMVVSSRRTPRLGLSRLRLEESLVEVGTDHLRFRSWETEELFRSHYRDPILPEEASVLTRRTGGWAAGLQLFHLATRGKSRTERSQILARFGTRSRLVGEYLADNIMEDLPAPLADFLVRTCPLGVLTGRICDDFLGRSGSATVLEELEGREMFVTTRDDGLSYSYHAVLRNHLDGQLVGLLGEAAARAEHHRAGRMLLAVSPSLPGAGAAAFRAFCRAEAWGDAAAAIRQGAENLLGDELVGFDGIPSELLDSDPWLQLATARRHLASGRLDPALATYRRCEVGLPQRMASVARAEMMAVSAWTSASPGPAPGWSASLRRAVACNPLGELPDTAVMSGAEAALAGVGALLAGRVTQAVTLLQQASLLLAEPVADLAVRVLLAAARAGGDGLAAGEVLALAAEAERIGVPWLERQAMSLLGFCGAPDMVAETGARCRSEGDSWGELLCTLAEAAGRLISGEARPELWSDAVERARRLGAGVLEVWARAGSAAALSASGEPGARAEALAAESLARRAGVPGAVAVCHWVLSGQGGDQAGGHLRLALDGARDCGFELRAGSGPIRLGEPGGPDPVRERPLIRLRCFGELEVLQGDRPVDLGTLRPRARALLGLLAVRWPEPVHAEVLVEHLWPGVEPASGTRNLHTAVSAIRRALTDAGGDGPLQLVRRDEAYLLIAGGSDLADFDGAVEAAQTARQAGDRYGELAALRRALGVHRGAELLHGAGPADWLIRERDRRNWQAGDAAERLATLELQSGRPTDAGEAVRIGLSVDRYRDSLWQLAIEAAEVGGDAGLAATRRAMRDAALAELGL